jgi:hypothetical protein
MVPIRVSGSPGSTDESRTKPLVPLPRIFQRLLQRWLCAALAVAQFGGALDLGACRRDPRPSPRPREAYVRGDRVVAEQAAAQFFEGRVLAAEADQLRVQAIGGNESLNVVASDVYRLPPAAHALTPNMLAICGRAEVWEPCRLSQINAGTLRAKSALGVVFEVSRERVLVPSALTELNLKRYFARSEAQLSFARSAERAGEPRPEPSWRPSVHERVLVKLGPDWFTGYVREIADERAQVTLGTAERSAAVSLSALAAEPPSSFVNELRRGDFVLVRPETPSEPWRRCQIRSLNDQEILLSDAAGAAKSASTREVVPLRP